MHKSLCATFGYEIHPYYPPPPMHKNFGPVPLGVNDPLWLVFLGRSNEETNGKLILVATYSYIISHSQALG